MIDLSNECVMIQKNEQTEIGLKRDFIFDL